MDQVHLCHAARLARAVFFAAAAVTLSCGAGKCSAATPQRYNIVLIVVDCLRADHLSLNGYKRQTSPNIDAFAKDASVFSRAFAQGNNTLLSFASLFTSLNVSAHGVTSMQRALGDSALTLPEILKIYNYNTAAFLGGPLLHPIFRLNQGFDLYSYNIRTDSSFKETLPKALKWATEKNAKKEPFFLLAHGNDLHTPYSFPSDSLYTRDAPLNPLLAADTDWQSSGIVKRTARLKGKTISLSDSDVRHILARYDEGVNYTDKLIGGFLDDLRAKRMLDDTIVILSADHGEGLFDHDNFYHNDDLSDGTLRVPLIIKVPGMAARSIASPVQLIDLMPTLLDLAGIAPAAEAQGRSLKPLLEGQAPAAGSDRDIISESDKGVQVIHSGKFKLINYKDKSELYDLDSDPGELKNLAGTDTATAELLKKKLLARQAAGKGTDLSKPNRSMDSFGRDFMNARKKAGASK